VKVHLIHGIHTGGPSWIQGFTPYLGPIVSVYPDYGWIAGLETKVANPIIVGCLKPYIAPDDVLICHSNGCAIAYDLMNAGVKMAGAVFINAALEQRIVRPPGVGWIDVYFNNGDDITEAAKVGAALGLTDKVWGEMGHAGYLGSDPNISNTDCTNGLPPLSGHSDMGTPAKFAAWGPHVVNAIHAHIARTLHSEAYA
jgi:hypothetical protein